MQTSLPAVINRWQVLIFQSGLLSYVLRFWEILRRFYPFQQFELSWKFCVLSAVSGVVFCISCFSCILPNLLSLEGTGKQHLAVYYNFLAVVATVLTIIAGGGNIWAHSLRRCVCGCLGSHLYFRNCCEVKSVVCKKKKKGWKFKKCWQISSSLMKKTWVIIRHKRLPSIGKDQSLLLFWAISAARRAFCSRIWSTYSLGP